MNNYLITVSIRNDTQEILTQVTGYIWVPGEWMMGKPPLIEIVPSLMPGESVEFSSLLAFSSWLPPVVHTQAQGILGGD